MRQLYRLVLVFLFSISICSNLWAVKIEESYFVHSKSPTLLKNIMMNSKLVLDHPSDQGFEVYGPKGLGEYLKSINVKFTNLDQDLRTSKSNKVSYPSYEEVVLRLKNAVARFPHIMKMFSIGKTVKGRDLWVVKISDNVAVDEVEPEFKYISSMHGDEIVGRELLQNFIEDLGNAYTSGDKEIVSLINNAEVFIMPSMNPDGSEIPQRGNGNNVDLNRNFPNPFSKYAVSPRNSRGDEKIEPETAAVMKFQQERNFVLSANFHGGAVVFNYPWDSIYARHPLNEFLIDISLDYSKLNTPMWNSREFKQGITNGADWYVVLGGMQDWSYVVHNDLQFTVELSDIKYPSFSQIPQFYKDNKQSLLSFINYVFHGSGFYWADKKNESGIVDVSPESGTSLGKFAWKNGEFFKVLPEGKYIYSIFNNQGVLLKRISVSVALGNSASYAKL